MLGLCGYAGHASAVHSPAAWKEEPDLEKENEEMEKKLKLSQRPSFITATTNTLTKQLSSVIATPGKEKEVEKSAHAVIMVVGLGILLLTIALVGKQLLPMLKAPPPLPPPPPPKLFGLF